MGLNKQQQKINDTHKRNVIVSASAGTGKTTVLTARLIDYIKEGNSISDYLVVSFTEAAANELKDRVLSALKKAITDADDQQKEHYRKEIAKIPLANISTIHSFCLEVIRKYGYVLGINPQIAGRLADEGKLQELKDAAFKAAISDKEHNSLIYRFSDRCEDVSGLQKEVENVDRFLENLDKADEWKAKQLNMYQALAKGNFSVYPEDLDQVFEEMIGNIAKAESSNQQIYRNNLKPDSKTLAKAEALHDELSDILNRIRKLLKEKDYDGAAELAFMVGPYPALGNTKIAEELKIEANENKALFDEEIKKLRSYYKVVKANRENAPVVVEFLQIVEKYRSVYNALKEENEVIGFEDMLTKAEEILNKNEGLIANIYRSKFKEIMVDEYQDTNQIQENIIRSIGRENNIFRVGDIKQSIYKFQNAKPQIMKELIANRSDNDAILPLQYNYRSHQSIIRFSNYIFDRLMNIRERNYEPERDDLNIPDVSKDKIGEKIQLISVPYESDEKITEIKNGKSVTKAMTKFKAKTKTEFIGNYIASEIVRLKQTNVDLKWKDFVVLVRANSRKATLKRILSRHNIPVYTTAKTGFFADAAVSAVISLLNLIEKDSELHRVNVLASNLFNRSYDEIALKMWEKQNGSKEEDELDELLAYLKEYRKQHMPIDLLNQIYNYHDFYMEKISSYQRSNLDSLYQLVLDYQQESDSTMDLLTYLNTYKKVDKEEASSFTSKDDVVQIMTIHQSKGLEYEYVFIADVFFAYNRQKESSLINVHDKAGIVPKYVSLPYKITRTNPCYEAVKEANRYEDFEEELRVLYVAITRAKRGLYVVDALKFDEEAAELDEAWLYDKSMSCWIKTALRDCKAEIAQLFEIKQLSEKDMSEHDVSAQKEMKDSFVADKYLEEELIKKESETINPSKQEDREFNTLSFSKASGSQRGTLMHKAVELLGIREMTMRDIESLPFDLDEEDKEKILGFYKDPFTHSLIQNRNEGEYPFIAYIDGNMINGTIDLLSIGEKAYVIDFKSDRNTNETKLKERYSGQLNLYRDIVSRYYPDKKIETLIFSFELGKYVEI